MKVVSVCLILGLLAFLFSQLEGCKKPSLSADPLRVYWVESQSSGGDLALLLETRYVMEPQFHNNITGESGQFRSHERFVPGPAPVAEKLAQQNGFASVYFYKHSATLLYKDGYLTKGNLDQEVAKLESFLQTNVNPGLKLSRLEYPADDPEDCACWVEPFRCDDNTLYVPKDRVLNRQAISQIIGISLIDDSEGHFGPGYQRIHKSRLFSWQELKPSLEPLLK